MPKLSKDSVQVSEHGHGKEWATNVDGYRISIVETMQAADLTPLLKGLPNDQCHSPHWGFVLKGSMWWRYDDHEEVTEAGDVFFIPPGHTAGAAAGSEFVIFSPTKELDVVEAHMARRAQELYGALQLKG